jgi:SAM-dependent methyltransferase
LRHATGGYLKRLTDVSYWEESWWTQNRPEKLRLVRDFDYETVRLLGRACRELSAAFPESPVSVLEMGAGGSRVLPYVGRRFGCRVFGSDFSLSGCRLLGANLVLQGLRQSAICEDLFQSSLRPNAFGLVFSCGLIEHFDDTRAAIMEHLRVVRPGGRLLLMVPNFEGVQGRIWKRWARPLWERHRVFGRQYLADILEDLKLESVETGYLGSFFIHVGIGDDWTQVKRWPRWLQHLVHYSVRLVNGALSLLFRLLPFRPHSRAFSTAFYATGIKPRNDTA